jgi:oxygen-independent coproporphyrinogen-3 oxidase
MLKSAAPDADAVRFSTADSLEKYVAGSSLDRTVITRETALEENFFLGLRLNRGVNLRQVATIFGNDAVENLRPTIAGLIADGLLFQESDHIRLTPRGRLLSNEVFQAFLAPSPIKS